MSLNELYQLAPWIVYPLLVLCSVLERAMALRARNVVPKDLVDHFVSGDLMSLQDDLGSAGGRIVAFHRRNQPDPEALKAFAQLEITRLERGLFLLDIVVAAAPLLGLLGTITGLTQVFSFISEETGLPEPEQFVQGIALALYTTMAGLAVAIPAIVGNSFLSRRAEMLASQIDIGVERLLELAAAGHTSQKEEG